MNKITVRSKLIANISAYSTFYVTSFILIVFFSIIGALRVSMTTGTEVDWLNQSDWSHFTGSQKTDSGIRIFPTERTINHRDTSTAQPNPPVNIRGSYLRVSGDFQIDMKLSGIDNETTLQLYGQVPVIYDEWRQERPSIRITTTNDEVYVRIWDGTAVSSIDERKFKVDLENDGSLRLVRDDGVFAVYANGRRLGTIPDHNIFSQGTIWFGADAKLGSNGWTLKSLTARGFKKEYIKLVEPFSSTTHTENPNALRNLSQKISRKISIGAAVSFSPLFTDKKYNEIALSQFNMMTPENSFKPQVIHPKKDLYLFNETDGLVEVAHTNEILVHGHSLVMGKANPEWMQKTLTNERQQVMIDHIGTVVGRYKGRVAQWDVVNEPLSEDDIDYSVEQKGLRKQMWFDAMGEEYIDISFKAARAADPAAKLFLNDFGMENDGQRWDAFLSLVKRLQARGVPIDGVGFESHVYHVPADNINPATLKQHIQVLASLGIESRISEIDVLGDDPELQAKQYADVLKVCLSEPTCTSYGIWGITDLYGSTTLSDRYPVMLGDSLLWDIGFTPKLALKSLQEVFSQP